MPQAAAEGEAALFMMSPCMQREWMWGGLLAW
jgi:hypothetical protein